MPTERQCEACENAAPERWVPLGERRAEVNGSAQQKSRAAIMTGVFAKGGVAW